MDIGTDFTSVHPGNRQHNPAFEVLVDKFHLIFIVYNGIGGLPCDPDKLPAAEYLSFELFFLFFHNASFMLFSKRGQGLKMLPM